MNNLNLDTYRAAFGGDSITINGATYPLATRLSFREALRTFDEFAALDPGSAEGFDAYVAKFAEISGIPLDVLQDLTVGEAEACVAFFTTGRQRFSVERFGAAVSSVTA